MTTRSYLPSKISDLLQARANVALHGSPGAGKSWLRDKVESQLDVSRAVVIQLDLSVVSSGREALSVIADALPSSSPKSAALDDVDLQAAWREARSRVTSCQSLVILLLDQFDRVIHFPDAQDFLLRLRELVHRPESLGCVALVISRRSLQSIELIVRGISTLASICYQEYLGAVRNEDLDDVAWASSSELNADQRLACLEWSGGHPALVKYWLATRPDARPDPAAEAQRTAVMFRVLDYIKDAELLDAAAQLVLGPVLKDWTLEAQELELLGILPDPAGDNRYVLSTQEVFRAALKSRTWGLDPWGLFGRCEVATRGAIESLMFNEYGEDWVTVLSKRNGEVRKVYREATEKLERDKRTFRRHASWLSYTYPGDLWTIISAEWTIFSRIFNTRDRAHWRTIFTQLSSYRAPMAHGRPEILTPEQRTQCLIYAREVLDQVVGADDLKAIKGGLSTP